jgi:metallo-beta-lactamase class B
MAIRGFTLWAILLVSPFLLFAQKTETERSWNRPVEPFKIIGNIYYVGANEITSFLITTPQGHIVVDGGFVETAPQILANIKKLGFEPEDVKFLLNSQSHHDHAGGFAELKRVTGAKLAIMEQDKAQIENGGKGDFAWGDAGLFPAVKVDRTLHDGDMIALGGTTLRAVRTPGHTKGCTTWTMTVTEIGTPYNVVWVCSTTAPGYKLLGNVNYPNIVQDYHRTFDILKKLPCDVFLASHGNFFDLDEKSKQVRTNTAQNPFIDPDGYRQFLEQSQHDFEAEVKRQQAGQLD